MHGRLRTLASSPVLAVASLVIGAVGGATEALSYSDDVVGLVIGDDAAEEDPHPFGPAQLDPDDVRLVVVLSAFALGVLGFVAFFVARRRPKTSAYLLLSGGAVGLAVTFVAGVNVLLLALSVLLAGAGLVLWVTTRPLARPSVS
jgi:hypothetical protein